MLKRFLTVQVYVHEAQEFQTGIDDLRYRRRASGKSENTSRSLAAEWDIPDVINIQAILMLYTKALQQGLQVCTCCSSNHRSARKVRMSMLYVWSKTYLCCRQ